VMAPTDWPHFCAEASSNHNGDLERALELVDVAANAGFDSVKFQLFTVDDLFSPEAHRVKPELSSRVSWELSRSFLPELSSRAREQGLKFSCTPFSLDAVEVIRPVADFMKVASYELLWRDLLIECAQTGLPVVLSTGMASEDEITVAVETLAGAGCSNITLLHCVSAYPTPPSSVNLAAIETLRRRTGLPVGWSDHTTEPAVIDRAVHRWGASFVEMHLDADGSGAEFGPGHCWLPGPAASVITGVRMGIAADGDGQKVPAPEELFEREWRADPSDGLRPLLATREQLRASSG